MTKIQSILLLVLLVLSCSFALYRNSQVLNCQEELEDVKSELKEANDQMNEKDETIDDLNGKIKDLQSELDDCESEKQSLQDDADDLDYRNQMNLLQQSVPEDERIIY